jgi:DNA polymerase III subunit beta
MEQECAEEELEVDYQGEEFEIAFNNSYLIDALNAIDTKQVQFEFTSANSSCLITPVGESSSKYVVMPMRL